MSLVEAKLIAALPRNHREELRVALSTFKGATRCDVRVWYLPHEGGEEFRPAREGVSVRLEQLPALIAALDKAQRVSQAGQQVPQSSAQG